jgi:hypothetical protein
LRPDKSDGDPHDEIVRLETHIEELAAKIESCRKFTLASPVSPSRHASRSRNLRCRPRTILVGRSRTNRHRLTTIRLSAAGFISRDCREREFPRLRYLPDR